MQFLMIVLSVTTAGFCYDGNLHGPELPGWSPVDAAIQFQVLNTYNITWAYHALGLASWEGGGAVTIVFVNNIGDELNSLDPATGGGAGAVPKPAGAGYGFGVAYNGDPGDPYWIINSSSYPPYLWYTEDQFATWQTAANPAGTYGRGMSYDGEYYWQSNGTDLIRFTPGGAGTSFPDMAPILISGVTVVPGDNPSHTYVMITTYEDMFVLYEYDGSGMTQVAIGVTPPHLGVRARLGLCWCNTRNSLFFSYSTPSGGCKISELTFEVLSLSPDTWAGIKSSF